MEALDYDIDDKRFRVSVEGSPGFEYGKPEVLSGEGSDLCFGQPWYAQGFTSTQLFEPEEFREIKIFLQDKLAALVRKETSGNLQGFELESYHKYVTDPEHQKVVSKTRDLFGEDFSFPIRALIPRFEDLLWTRLTDKLPNSEERMHIIVRVNRPGSHDYNPPHKDIYEAVDIYQQTPRMINFWIPIAGVTERSSLPLAPGSHLLSEDKILRTVQGGVMAGNRYRVRSVQSWDGSNRLVRSRVRPGEVLIFSSYLIHGLAVNEERDLTRVALEFRLFGQ